MWHPMVTRSGKL